MIQTEIDKRKFITRSSELTGDVYGTQREKEREKNQQCKCPAAKLFSLSSVESNLQRADKFRALHEQSVFGNCLFFVEPGMRGSYLWANNLGSKINKHERSHSYV